MISKRIKKRGNTMKRDIITIDEDKCVGCGLCVPNCHMGVLEIIDGKAKVMNESACDGLGRCLGDCPTGALKVVSKEMPDPVKPVAQKPSLAPQKPASGGCPGMAARSFGKASKSTEDKSISGNSELRQWPVQMHLVSPQAEYFQEADLLLAADCVAFALGDFHSKHLKGKGLAIACPKLDSQQEAYIAKLVSLIDDAKVNTITVMRMEVPCCGGLTRLVEQALTQASRKVPVKVTLVSVEGEIKSSEWL